MSTYVISDIHGCYDDFMAMLKKIKFKEEDYLILGGDYIDRGRQNLEMLEWLENAPSNVKLLRGNHDHDFIGYIDSMKYLIDKFQIYDLEEIYKRAKCRSYRFDHYGTIKQLIIDNKVNFEKLLKFRNIFDKMEYIFKTIINGKPIIVVHGGYISEEDFGPFYEHSTIEEYYLWARDEAYERYSGIQDGIVIAGHTPTIARECKMYNRGYVYKQYNEVNNCTLYDIDCGCVFAYKGYDDGRLACIRLEDEKRFYIKPKPNTNSKG